MKKVLIFLEESKIHHGGGPYGYVSNLMQGLSNLESNYEFHFLPDSFLEKKNSSLSHKIDVFIPYNNSLTEYIQKFDAIHFHTSRHMFKARNSLKNYSGKILYTSHSPMLLSKEMKDDARILSRIFLAPYFALLPIIDCYAFSHADQIIFPCKEAEEPYLSSKIFRKAKQKIKFAYFETGAPDCKQKIKFNREQYRLSHNIPLDRFVISYVGRHNRAKGYDLLKKLGKDKKNEDLFFLVGGKESPIKGLTSQNWLEIGYTDDPFSLINASDLFILPNRSTYFDLVLLEVLSLGKKVLIADNGGNRFFHRYNSNSIFFFKSFDDLEFKVREIMNSNSTEDTRDIYLQNFTCDAFANRYIRLLDEII